MTCPHAPRGLPHRPRQTPAAERSCAARVGRGVGSWAMPAVLCEAGVRACGCESTILHVGNSPAAHVDRLPPSSAIPSMHAHMAWSPAWCMQPRMHACMHACMHCACNHPCDHACMLWTFSPRSMFVYRSTASSHSLAGPRA
eukprot:365661-Chlamydomonas_euryale.AAC.68